MQVNEVSDGVSPTFIVTVCGLWLLQTLSMCRVSVPLLRLIMGRILIKLDENVGITVQSIVL